MLEQWYADAVAFALRHRLQIAVAFTASLLALYGTDITRAIKRRTRKWPFLARSAVFVLVVGFGFGALVLATAPLISRCLLLFGRQGVIPMVLLCVMGLGLLAQSRRLI
jgi:Protein of unknown function (DUF3392)